MTRWRGWGLLGLCVFVAACATSAPERPPVSEVGREPFVPTEFLPAAYRADLRHVSGPYGTLFDRPSFALWVGQPVAEAKRFEALERGEILEPGLPSDAEKIIQDFILIELHLESAFGDMAVSYDAVAMRSLEARLVLPDGTEHEPVQRVLGRLLEADDGALKRFKRYNLLIFPRRDLITGQPLVPVETPTATLVLEGYNTAFHFEWQNLSPGLDPGPIRAREAVDYVRVGFQDLFLTVRRLAHVFD